MVKKFGLVAALLATVCCGALLAGCANGDGEENDIDYNYEEKKKLDYWNKDYNADDFKWIEITNDNRDKIVGTWKSIIEFTNEKEMVQADEIGYSASMEFVIDDSFEKCKFIFISDSSICNSKRWYKSAETEESENGGATEVFPQEFDVKGYGFNLNFDDKNCIATATAKDLTLKQLIEVLHCEGLFISTTEDGLLLLLLKNRDKNLPATWQFTAGTDDEHCYDYVIAKAE